MDSPITKQNNSFNERLNLNNTSNNTTRINLNNHINNNHDDSINNDNINNNNTNNTNNNDNSVDVKKTKLTQILPKITIPPNYDKSSPKPTPNPVTSSSSSGPRSGSSSVDFRSPALLAKPQEPNMSPDMSQNTCNCKKSRCLKL